MQVRSADVVIDAVDAALEDREEALHGVRVDVAAHVLVIAMGDRLMI